MPRSRIRHIGCLFVLMTLAACRDSASPTTPLDADPNRTADALTAWDLAVDTTHTRQVTATDPRLVGTWMVTEPPASLGGVPAREQPDARATLALEISAAGAWRLTVDGTTAAKGPIIAVRSGHVVLQNDVWDADGWIDLYAVARLQGGQLVMGPPTRRNALHYQRVAREPAAN